MIPTIYDVIGITPPRVVNGVPQDPIDGVSFAYAFAAPDVPGRLTTQYFEVMGSRAIYHIVLSVDTREVAAGRVPVSAPLLFTANDCLDIGRCLGGRVSLDYYERAPFPFTGTINNVNVRYTS